MPEFDPHGYHPFWDIIVPLAIMTITAVGYLHTPIGQLLR